MTRAGTLLQCGWLHLRPTMCCMCKLRDREAHFVWGGALRVAIPREAVRKMIRTLVAFERANRLRHPGPDWNGVHVQKGHALSAVLAHERLGIVDLASGKQPLFDASRQSEAESEPSPEFRGSRSRGGSRLL
ncbi:asparagine synthetase b [Cystoisospora suis]|uniref:Asparagine synthetase b n=1 Tax=Cystoisospora suis TaxID=483139 RepID=A0A2C6KRP9_9APIC|nr:asparagine synthetase b [Cystoisospora suis]